jgi:predicted Zn-dependent protease with MMP-like domain
VPVHRTARQEFDALVADVLAPLAKHFDAEPDRVDVVVEDVPLLPPDWSEDVPTSSLTRRDDVSLVVLYRRPLTDRSAGRADLEDQLWDVVLHRLAEVWQVSPDDLDPR